MFPLYTNHITLHEMRPGKSTTLWIGLRSIEPILLFRFVSMLLLSRVYHCLSIYTQDFLPRLQAHLLSRLRGIPFNGVEPSFPVAELDTVRIQHDRIVPHATATFNYTTYDVRRDQDTINTNGQRRDVMVRSHEDADEDGDPAHPYWYARVLGVFHAQVYHGSSRKPQHMEFLWVRWFGREIGWSSGPRNLKLDRVGFVPEEYREAFGFLDPSDVVRACHLIPTFKFGKTMHLLGPSIARDSPEGDWQSYYVMRQVSSESYC